MARLTVPAAEAMLDKEYPVLDQGFVRLIDYLGGDERIVAAARVSYGPGTKSFREDKALINYLMKNLHTSPFEQVILTFHAKMPIFVARQWVRHRTARLNEVSGRYSILPDEFYLPSPDQIRRQSKRSKQGRTDEDLSYEFQRRILDLIKQDQVTVYGTYRKMLDEDDIARELARINLPLSLYTQWYWQIDLHNLFHFLRLRLDPHAQHEIRQYAEVMAQMAKAVAPIAYETFEEHVLHSVHFSKTEKERLIGVLKNIADQSSDAADLLKKLTD